MVYPLFTPKVSMNTTPLYQKISQTLSWNAGEAITYHLLLMLHQMCVFYVLTPSLFGVIGTAFSLLYLSVWLIDLGLESTLAPRFTHWSLSKSHARTFFLYNSIPNLVFFLITTTFLIWHTAQTALVITIAIAVLCEYFRRITKGILLLLFDNRFIAIAEAVFMLTYLSLVWTCYLITHTLTIYTTIIPLIISSALSSFLCAQSLNRWYLTLPTTTDNVQQPSFSAILRIRLFPYINTVGMLFFSSNFLVPLFATQFGTSHAGLLKLATTLVHSITIVLQRTFGNTCRAVLAHLKSIDTQAQQDIFMTISTYLYQALYALMIFCFINHRFVTRICGAADQHGIALLSLFFVINFLDNFIITLEKLYEMNERTEILSIFNGISIIILLCIALTATSWSSPITLLIVIALTRISIVALTIGFTCIFYRIAPHKAVQPTFILSAIATSLLFLFSIGK